MVDKILYVQMVIAAVLLTAIVIGIIREKKGRGEK